MSEKSHVSLEQNICVVCCKKYDTGSLLLDKRIKPTMEQHTLTAWGMCPEHLELKNKGYVALVGIDEQLSKIRQATHADPNLVHRTGGYAHLRVNVFKQLIDQPVPEKMLVFVSDEFLRKLEKIASPGKDEVQH